MAPKNKETQRKDSSAVITEETATNNPNLKRQVDSLVNDFKSRSANRDNRNVSLREHRIAMVFNPKPIWVYADNEAKTGAYCLFRAGWYLSAEEIAIRDRLLEIENVQALNEHIYKEMEDAGIEVEKTPPTNQEAKVVG